MECKREQRNTKEHKGTPRKLAINSNSRKDSLGYPVAVKRNFEDAYYGQGKLGLLPTRRHYPSVGYRRWLALRPNLK